MNKYPVTPLQELKASGRYSMVGGPFGSKLVSRDYADAGVPVIRGGNLPAESRFSFDDLAFVTDEKVAADLLGNLAFPGDIVVTQRGTLGQVGLIPDDSPYPRFVVSQSQMKLTVDHSKADPLFVYYALRSPVGQHEILSRAITAGVPHINLSLFQQLKVPLPPTSSQRKIAAVLSAYDDLIDNNIRRIKLLEEMAQRIFHEWFVDFRYPGHEGVPMMGSELGLIPEGWRVSPLGDVCLRVLDGDWIESKDQGGDAYRLLQVSNIGLGSFRETGNFRYISQDTFARLRCTEIRAGFVLVSRMPDPIGRAWYVDHLEERAVTAVDVAILEPNPGAVDPRYCAFFLNTPRNLQYAAQRASGTTRLRITRRDLATFPILLPPSDVREAFAAILKDNGEMNLALRLATSNLRETRDLLLGRLISGEVDVTDLNIATEQAAA